MKKIRALFDKLRGFKTINLLTILIIAAALPITLIVARQQQDLRQHADAPTANATLNATTDYGPIDQSFGIVMPDALSLDDGTVAKLRDAFPGGGIYLQKQNPTTGYFDQKFQALDTLGFKWYFRFTEDWSQGSIIETIDEYFTKTQRVPIIEILNPDRTDVLKAVQTKYGNSIILASDVIDRGWDANRSANGKFQAIKNAGVTLNMASYKLFFPDEKKDTFFSFIRDFVVDTFYDIAYDVGPNGAKMDTPESVSVAITAFKDPSSDVLSQYPGGDEKQKRLVFETAVLTTAIGIDRAAAKGNQTRISYFSDNGLFILNRSSVTELMIPVISKILLDKPTVVWPEAFANNGGLYNYPPFGSYANGGSDKSNRVVGFIGKKGSDFEAILTNTSSEAFTIAVNGADFSAYTKYSSMTGQGLQDSPTVTFQPYETIVLTKNPVAAGGNANPNPTPPANSTIVCPSGTTGQNGCDFVGGDGIQQAIDAINDGQDKTIFVKAGTYTPTYKDKDVGSGSAVTGKCALVVKGSKTVTIIGEPNTIIDLPDNPLDKTGGSHAYGVCQIDNDKLTLKSLRFTNSKALGNMTGVHSLRSKELFLQGINIDTNRAQYAVTSRNSDNININNSLLLGEIFTIGVGSIQATNNTVTQLSSSGSSASGYSCFELSNYQTRNTAIIAINNICTNFSTWDIRKQQGNVTMPTTKYNISNTPDQSAECSLCSGEGSSNKDPGFVSNTDFHLSSGSPAKNAGDPSIKNSDGSRSDIGAYGGPDACLLDNSLPGCNNPSSGTTTTPTTAATNPTVTAPTTTATSPTVTAAPNGTAASGTCSIDNVTASETGANSVLTVKYSGQGGNVTLEFGRKGDPTKTDGNSFERDGFFSPTYATALSQADTDKIKGLTFDTYGGKGPFASDVVKVGNEPVYFKVYQWDKKFRKSLTVNDLSTAKPDDFITGKATGWWYYVDSMDAKTTARTKEVTFSLPKGSSIWLFCDVRDYNPDKLVCIGNPVCAYNDGPDVGAQAGYACDAWKKSCGSNDYYSYPVSNSGAKQSFFVPPADQIIK